MNETNEHNPASLSKEQVGDGWRLLKAGERLLPGDQWFGQLSKEWISVPDRHAGMEPYGYATYRRVDGQSARIAELERRVEELTEENGELRGKLNRECANHDAARDDADVRAGQILALRAEVERLTKERDQAKREWAEDFEVRTHLLRERDEARAERDMEQKFRQQAEKSKAAHFTEMQRRGVEVDELRAQLAEREEDRWQPIETAPLDTPVLILGYWKPSFTEPKRRFAVWERDSRKRKDDFYSPEINGDAVFWQPIPQPPAARAQPEDGK